LEIAVRAERARRAYLRDYWEPRYVAQIIGAPRELVEARRARGWAADDLSAHYNKVCLETALGMLRASWAGAIAEAKRRAFSNSRLSQAQKQLLTDIVRSPEALRACLLDESVAQATDKSAVRWLRRTLLRARGQFPATRGRAWFDLDCNLYRPFIRTDDTHFRGAWLAVTGLAPGQRIKIPLAGNGISEFGSRTGRDSSRPNVRVVISERAVFHVLGRETIHPRNGNLHAGLDKGYKTLVTITTGNPEGAVGYGVSASALIDRITARAETRLRDRRRLVAYERSLRNTTPTKARNLRRRNLHALRVRSAARRDRAELRQQVDTALNSLFRDHKSVRSIAIENLRFRGRRSNPPLNRRLARWLKGYIDERLRYKAELNGVELKVVSAAYTSQACPRCWFASADNRSGDKFECGDCGYTGSADAVAATNILRRGSDPAITQFTPFAAVRQILDERWRSARNGRAWGSNSEGARLGRARACQPRAEPRTTSGVTAATSIRRRSVCRICRLLRPTRTVGGSQRRRQLRV